MNLCSDNHDEVCYEGRNCPACELRNKTVELTEKINDLNSTIDGLKDEIWDLKSQIEFIKNDN